MRQASIDRELESAGIAVADADIAVRQPGRSYSVPTEIEIASAAELKSPFILKPGPRRLAWPWVKKDGLVLTYKWARLDRSSPAKGSCLKGFLELATVSDDALPGVVLSFAQQWGPLGICEHRKPRNHRDSADSPCMAISTGSGLRTEPLEAWRRYSRQLRAILRVAAQLQLDKPGNSQDWGDIEGAEPAGLAQDDEERWGLGGVARIRGASRVIQERHVITLAVGQWFRYGEIKLFPQWGTARSSLSEHRFEIDTAYFGLPGRLAVDLAAALSSPNGIYQCAGCGKPFTPKEDRKRAHNREKWCDSTECKREQLRRNSRRLYNKRKQQEEVTLGEKSKRRKQQKKGGSK